jgi:plasmid stabilization system protein ParE
MSSIRSFERSDLEAVALLHAHEEGPRPDDARVEAFRSFFERTLLDQPWADPEIPSLVYEESGNVLGFLGSNVRRMRFDGNEIRMACSAHLISHPSVRHKAVGARLLGTHLNGAQDLTITDGANEVVRRIWEGLRGQTVHVGCVTFARVLRPFALATHRLASRGGVAAAETVLTPFARTFDAAVTRVLDRSRPAPLTTQPLTPALLAERVAELPGLRLVPDYDEGYLTWLFAELARVGREQVFANRVPRGTLVAESVVEDGRSIGWYVAHVRPRGLCRVLQLASTREAAGAVADALTERARRAGAVGVYGRLEPSLVGPLSERRTLLRFSHGRLLVHAREQAIVGAILRGQALLTRLEGEWW